MKRSSGWGRLQSYMLNELQPLYDRLGFEASRAKVLRIEFWNDLDPNRKGQMRISLMRNYESRCWQPFVDSDTMSVANHLHNFSR